MEVQSGWLDRATVLSTNCAKISVVTVTKNAGGTIKDCLESVKNQDYTSEHIVIDGASSDDTLKIVLQYEQSLARIVSEPDKGLFDAMNKGIGHATGDIIAILNSDDFYANRSVLSKVAEIFRDENFDSCYGDIVYVAKNDISRVVRYWKSGAYKESAFYFGWMPPHSAFFVRREIYERYGGFNLEFGTSADYELMLRFLLKHRISTAYIHDILTVMRAGGIGNASLRNRLRANRFDRLAWRANGLKPRFWTLSAKPIRKMIQYLPLWIDVSMKNPE
jgi:glycosyltransferase involved in cell wall biosynthesis